MTKKAKANKAQTKEENATANKAEETQKPKGQEVFNFNIPNAWSKELAIFKEVIAAFRGKKTTFSELMKKAIELRSNPKYDLKPWKSLTAKTARNFENRFSRFLGGTIERGFYKQSRQAQYFNIQVWTGQTCTFGTPIDPTLNLSPQVKSEEQTITIPRKKLVRVSEKITKENVSSDFLERLANPPAPKTEPKAEEKKEVEPVK